MQIPLICGLDEAGRGPLAGPVSAGAVILPPDFPVELLNDSKKLSEKRRAVLESLIKERACWGVALVDHTVIDEINILQASLLAMKLAFDQMRQKLPAFCASRFGSCAQPLVSAIADGTFCPDIRVPCVARPKADATESAVMAASILAKTERDRVMIAYGQLYPQYGYEKHKGYPTKAHRELCKLLGPSPIQRLTFHY
ncbi:ribonuclease HII [Treponema brennaborense]|uniref:Ribonuclease n=1 Tax=Treponema brennaborense (strain DSM 12168 / CIP 105900 / DD5/3) TaxID=906968 RepID=F4LPN9_TREBD|nr:ribonuclease HII [Treponema brennaborense]AEE17035.1 Ribonuclease H [Treponema brennaborense DSM 12168]